MRLLKGKKRKNISSRKLFDANKKQTDITTKQLENTSNYSTIINNQFTENVKHISHNVTNISEDYNSYITNELTTLDEFVQSPSDLTGSQIDLAKFGMTIGKDITKLGDSISMLHTDKKADNKLNTLFGLQGDSSLQANINDKLKDIDMGFVDLNKEVLSIKNVLVQIEKNQVDEQDTSVGGNTAELVQPVNSSDELDGNDDDLPLLFSKKNNKNDKKTNKKIANKLKGLATSTKKGLFSVGKILGPVGLALFAMDTLDIAKEHLRNSNKLFKGDVGTSELVSVIFGSAIESVTFGKLSGDKTIPIINKHISDILGSDFVKGMTEYWEFIQPILNGVYKIFLEKVMPTIAGLGDDMWLGLKRFHEEGIMNGLLGLGSSLVDDLKSLSPFIADIVDFYSNVYTKLIDYTLPYINSTIDAIEPFMARLGLKIFDATSDKYSSISPKIIKGTGSVIENLSDGISTTDLMNKMIITGAVSFNKAGGYYVDKDALHFLSDKNLLKLAEEANFGSSKISIIKELNKRNNTKSRDVASGVNELEQVTKAEDLVGSKILKELEDNKSLEIDYDLIGKDDLLSINQETILDNLSSYDKKDLEQLKSYVQTNIDDDTKRMIAYIDKSLASNNRQNGDVYTRESVTTLETIDNIGVQNTPNNLNILPGVQNAQVQNTPNVSTSTYTPMTQPTLPVSSGTFNKLKVY
jgi:hypothetical protein